MADQLRINLGGTSTSSVTGWNLFSKGDTLVNPTSTLNNVVEVTITNSGDQTFNVNSAVEGFTGLQIAQTGDGLYSDPIWKTAIGGTLSLETGGSTERATINFTNLKASTAYTVTFSANAGSSAPRDPTNMRLRSGATVEGPTTVNPENNLTLEASDTITTDGTGLLQVEFYGSTSGNFYYLPTYIIIEGAFPYQRAVILVGTDDTFKMSDTGVNVQVGNGGTSATLVQLVSGTYSVTQNNLTVVDDENITFDVVQDKLPFGDLELQVTIDGVVYTRPVTLNPDTNNTYVDISDPIYDDPNVLSILDNAPGSSPIPANGQQLEIRDATGTVSLAANGLYTVSSASTASFTARRWINTSIGWGNLVTITLTLGSSIISGNTAQCLGRGNQADVTVVAGPAGPISANTGSCTARGLQAGFLVELPQPDVTGTVESVVSSKSTATVVKNSPSWVIIEPKT